MPLMQVAKGIVPLLLLCSACAPVIATGSTATNLVQMQDRSIGTTIDDATIYGRVSEALIKLDSKEAYRGVGIDVSEGRVLMTGQVKNSENADKALRAAWATEGVREVINEIQVVPGGISALTYSTDAIVTSQAKSRLLAERGIVSSNYHLETVNGIVYVIGIARSEAEHKQAMNVISRAAGARKVISHVRVKSDKSELAELPAATVPPL